MNLSLSATGSSEHVVFAGMGIGAETPVWAAGSWEAVSMLDLHQIECDWIAVLQGSGTLSGLMLKASYFGLEAMPFVLPLVYFCIRREAGVRLFLLISFSTVLVHLLKLAFHSPRPCWMDPRIHAFAGAANYGLPSGHALYAALVWPFVAGTLGQWWAWALAMLLVLLVSVARVYLGVHFISDVIAAWAVAAGLLWCLARWQRRAVDRLESLGLRQQLVVALATASVFVVCALVVRGLLTSIPDPPAWASFSSGARNLDELFRTIGELFGVLVGICLAERWARFDVSGAVWRSGLAFGYALVGAWLLRELWQTLSFPTTEPVRWLFCSLKGAVSGGWILFLAPWLMVRVGILPPTLGAERGGTRHLP
jgi:membrane-associated phospholipid phosphatase